MIDKIVGLTLLKINLAGLRSEGLDEDCNLAVLSVNELSETSSEFPSKAAGLQCGEGPAVTRPVWRFVSLTL